MPLCRVPLTKVVRLPHFYHVKTVPTKRSKSRKWSVTPSLPTNQNKHISSIRVSATHTKPQWHPTSFISVQNTFHFSSSSSNNNNQTRPSDIKSSLKQPQSQSQSQQPHRPSFINSNPNPNTTTQKVPSLEEIRKNLTEFRRRSAVTPPPISFQEMYQRNVMPKPDLGSGTGTGSGSDEISESLKLREMDEKEADSNASGFKYSQLRESLIKLQDYDKTKKSAAQRINVFAQLGGTPSFMLSPPKEELVEKYFHPDHMSSAEKQKLELKSVRDKFKISESDCGSSRVQGIGEVSKGKQKA